MRAVTAEYTIDDDGIHLRCECGWTAGAGMSPTVDKLVEIASEHQTEHWIGEIPAALVGVAVATGLVMHEPDAFVRILRETTTDLVARVDQIVADLQRSADDRAEAVVSDVLSDADTKGGTGGA